MPWRSLKYEEVYLKGYQIVTESRVGIGAYFRFYNGERPHQALGYRTPGEQWAVNWRALWKWWQAEVSFSVMWDSGCLNPGEILPLERLRAWGFLRPEG